MRPSQKNRNARNKSGRKPIGNIVNRVYESAGPEGKVRGTPQQIIDKYLLLARDAQTSGDRVMAENFLQHAEHYIRLLSAAQAQMDERRALQGGGRFDEDQRDDGEDGDDEDLSPGAYDRPQPRQDERRFDERRPDERGSGERRFDERRPDERRFDERGDGRSRDERPRDERPRDERPRDERPRDERRRDDRPRGDRPREERRPEFREQPAREAPALGLETIDVRDEAEIGPVATPEDRAKPEIAVAPAALAPVAVDPPAAAVEAPAPEAATESPARASAEPRPRRRRTPKAAAETEAPVEAGDVAGG